LKKNRGDGLLDRAICHTHVLDSRTPAPANKQAYTADLSSPAVFFTPMNAPDCPKNGFFCQAQYSYSAKCEQGQR